MKRHNARIWFESLHIARWHQKQAFAGEADDFGLDMLIISRDNLTAITDGGLAASRLKRQSDHACQPTGNYRCGQQCCAPGPLFKSRSPAQLGLLA
jgi:hypothetical protein